MTYFGVLLRFIAPPLVILAAVALYDRNRRSLPEAFRTWPAWAILWGHVLIALIYTTPWDNYLVANRIWWYEPSLVTGITLWWVPIEEYTFFAVQTLMTGLWILALMRRLPLPAAPFRARPRARWISFGLAGALWLLWVVLLLLGWSPGRYMALLLGWFLPPVLLQLAFGADILWHYRRLVLVVLLVPTVYLCILDATAIASGTWTISPQYTVGLGLGVLPLEEIMFFFMTNVLIAFGTVLMLAHESHLRARTRVASEADLP
jgi:lycopene cyclase domain-containing protein